MLADGWYEWQPVAVAGSSRPRKQPYLMTIGGRPHAAFAGLYEWWRNPALPADSPLLMTATLLTTDAVGPAATVHDRMPVVLDPVDFADWLNPAGGELASQVLTTALAKLAQTPIGVRPVSPDVNAVRNDGPGLWDVFTPEPAGSVAGSKSAAPAGAGREEQPGLF